MKRQCDMIGNKFGRMTILNMVGERITGRHPKYECLCDCGNKKTISAVQLKTGREPSCGCATKEGKRFKNNLMGQKFNRLTVLRVIDQSDKKRHIIWECSCDCGEIVFVAGTYLRTGQVNSCGCLHKDNIYKTHGKTNTPAYISWASMITRCTNPNRDGYRHYGGRGISVCERWRKFENFLFDMGERPSGTSIDRIDVNGNYEPGNCRWATQSVQVANRRNKNEIK